MRRDRLILQVAIRFSEMEKHIKAQWRVALCDVGQEGMDARRYTSIPGHDTPKDRPLCRSFGSFLDARYLVDDDLDATVLRLTDALAGRHQQMRLTEALDRDRTSRHAVLDQFSGNRLGTLN
jgi:hypothetical protein